MMTVTGQQIEDDLYGLLGNSPLRSFIGGGIYRYGMRPRDSKKEDATVKFVTGLDGGIQTGVAVINIYVPDVYDSASRVMNRNVDRCRAIEAEANRWVKSLTADKTDYLFSLAQTVYTEEEPETEQHFVTVRIKFALLTV